MTVQDSLFAAADSGSYPCHVLSWGLGADSTAILLRWLHEPASRDFALYDLLVITAHTGDEYPSTLRDSEDVVLPALRAHGVRLVQVGRNRRNTTAAGDGITVFSDTSAPERLYANDGYALSDEHLGSVTGREWQKSACYQCPFQFSSKAGFAAAMERYRREPESGSRALYLEAVSVCFNPKQGLLAAGRLIDAVRAAGLTAVLQLFEMRIAAGEHGLYEHIEGGEQHEQT